MFSRIKKNIKKHHKLKREIPNKILRIFEKNEFTNLRLRTRRRAGSAAAGTPLGGAARTLTALPETT